MNFTQHLINRIYNTTEGNGINSHAQDTTTFQHVLLNWIQRSLVINELYDFPRHEWTIVKGKAIPLQALKGPEGSRRLRLPHFKTIGTWRWQGCQPYAPAAFTPRKYFWYSFLSRPQAIVRPEGLCQCFWVFCFIVLFFVLFVVNPISVNKVYHIIYYFLWLYSPAGAMASS
jgi:hypothetical protein